MFKGRYICLLVLFLIFFNSYSAGLKLGAFINKTPNSIKIEISKLQAKSKPEYFTILKDNFANLGQFTFDGLEGPHKGYSILYYINGRRNLAKKIIISYKSFVIDEKNCSKCGLCPAGYMASVNVAGKFYKNVYSPISQQGQACIDIILTKEGITLGGSCQILEPYTQLSFPNKSKMNKSN